MRVFREMMITVVFVLCLVLNSSHCTKEDVDFDKFFGLGVNSYHAYEWRETINNMQTSISSYKKILNARELCFNKCEKLETSVLPDYVHNQELQFFHRLTEHAVCREKCKKDHLEVQKLQLAYNHELQQSLKHGNGHNYIQMSLFKEGNYKDAARHAATNYYLNPHTPTVQANIEYYQSLEDVSNDDCESLEKKPYRDLYVRGQQLYVENKFEEMVEKFELSLKFFYEELNRCRLLCESPMKFSDSMVLADAMSFLYLSVLECRQSCLSVLGEFRKDEDNNFFGSYFHYIQFGYYKLDRLHDAVKALTTHRRIEPKNDVARMNAAYYQQLPGISNKDFIEREDAKGILDKLEEEENLLKVIEHLIADDADDEEEMELDDVQLLEEDFKNFPIIAQEPNVNDKKNVRVVESPTDHNGKERVVVDGLLTHEECKNLLELSEACKEGDGYPTKSPHTTNEVFEGLTVLGAAKAAVRKEVNFTQVQMYLNTSKLVQETVREQFDLQKFLYFSYTHLVCRTAKQGTQDDRADLSHPVHADNCILDQEVGRCLKIPPAYTWRDYSAILYLNDDFEGGEFFFAHSPKDLTPQHLVQPKCGRMVGFSAGEENLHGVRAVTEGRRCAVALWFTLDPNHKETTFVEAETLLGIEN